MNTKTRHDAAASTGGISLLGFRSLPPGAGALRVEEYFPWNDSNFQRDPYPWYERAMDEAPVILDDTGAYVVSRYEDIVEFAPKACMSVEPGWDAAGPWKVVKSTIIGHEGEDHTRLRRQTTRWLAPRAVRDWVVFTREFAEEIFDRMNGDVLDGWHDIALIVTHRTMCRLLQVDDGEAQHVMTAMAGNMPMLAANPALGSTESAEAGFAWLQERVTAAIAAHTAAPSDGLIDDLLVAEREGRMSGEEVHATVLMLYSLGHMDVGYLVASGLRMLAELPDVYDAYRNQEERRDAIINEIARLDPPELSFYRTTLEDVTIRGVQIPTGSRIRFMVGAANRDPAAFDNPHAFDILRPVERSRILSFGLGTHTCAGQGLARAEARTVLDAVASRFSSVELAEPFEMDNSDFSRHFTNLKIRFTK